MDIVSRTRCGVLHAAPQSRDPFRDMEWRLGPRISSPPRRNMAARCAAFGGKPHAMIGRNFQQAARHVYGVAGRRDVVIAFSAEPGGNNDSEMRADLEAKV